MSSMFKYTVLLLYPDYMGSDDPRGFGTFLAHVRADGPEAAAAMGRAKAAEDNNDDHEDDFADSDDFAVLAVFKGHLTDLTPEVHKCITTARSSCRRRRTSRRP